MVSPYAPLDVVETYSRADGRRYWVRDEDESHLWTLVEYVGNPGRLTCWCPDGAAHGESPDTEPECLHLRAVVELRQAAQLSSGPPLGVLKPSMFVD
jgi:hypothetical protein